jgi:methanogenic corrinoid protein MtbC1
MSPARKKGRSEASVFLDNLSEFLGDSEMQDLNDLKSEIREEGVDIDAFITKVKGMIVVKSTEAKRSWITKAKAGRVAALEKMKECKPDIPEDAPALIEKIKKIIAGGGSGELAGVYFRNLKDMPYEDLKKLCEDYLRLQHLKKKKEDEGQDSR